MTRKSKELKSVRYASDQIVSTSDIESTSNWAIEMRDPKASKQARGVRNVIVSKPVPRPKRFVSVFHLLMKGLIYQGVALHYTRDRLGGIFRLTCYYFTTKLNSSVSVSLDNATI
jgi:hypothetical protein